jgi:hypothetical protein
MTKVIKHFCPVSARAHVLENLPDPPLRIDHVGRPMDTFVSFPKKLFLAPDSKRTQHVLIRVREERVREIILPLELLMRLDGVGAHPQQHDLEVLETSIFLAEPASLDRSTGGVVFGIKEKDHPLAFELRKRPDGSRVVLE